MQAATSLAGVLLPWRPRPLVIDTRPRPMSRVQDVLVELAAILSLMTVAAREACCIDGKAPGAPCSGAV
jgi:hypothetical protein